MPLPAPPRGAVALAAALAVALAASAAALPAAPRLGAMEPGKACGVGGAPLPPAPATVLTPLAADFDAAAPPFALSATAGNLWHATAFAGKGPDAGHSQPLRLYFGLEVDGGSFALPRGASRGALTFLAPIAVPAAGETLITWVEKWEVESTGFGAYDVMAVQLVEDPHAPWASPRGWWVPMPPETVCVGNPHWLDPGEGPTLSACSPNLVAWCPAEPAWVPRSAAVPDHLKGRTLHLRLNFDSVDGYKNGFLGWMLDDLAVVALGPP